MRTRIEWTSWWRVFLKKEDGILVSPVYDRAVKWNAKALEHTIFSQQDANQASIGYVTV